MEWSYIERMRILFLFLWFPSLLLSQDFVDIVELDYQLSPQIPLTVDGQDEADITDLHARILYPHVIDSTSTLLLSLGYDRLDISPLELHTITGMIGFDKRLNDKYRLLALAIPKVSSDLITFSSRDVQVGGIALLSISIRDGFTWKVGLYGNTERFGPLVVPIIGFKWQASPSWRIEASLPLSAHIRKTLNPKLITGIKYSGRKYSYNLSKSDSYLEAADTHIWTYLDIYLASKWVLHLRGGHSVLRSYAVYPNEQSVGVSFGPVNIDDNRPEPLYERKNGASFQIGLRYRYGIE